MNMPCIVELDLHRHLRQMDWQDARDERAQELTEERRRYLTKDRPGFSLITEALFVEEIGYPLDEALFALYRVWRQRKPVSNAVDSLMQLIEDKAERMARQWTGLEMTRQDRVAQEPDEDDLPF
jgi:hypothetical protein